MVKKLISSSTYRKLLIALVVGFGSIGIRHTKNLLKKPNMKIIVNTKRKNIPPGFTKKCKFFNKISDCLNEKPDFAIIANETNLHMSTALNLAKHGLDIFIEKPLSNSMKDSKKLEKIVAEKKNITFVGCNLRFHKSIKKIKKLLTDKEIGDILWVRAESSSYLPDWHPNDDYRKSYASKKITGGGVVLTCIHELDYLIWFIGKITEVFSRNEKLSNLKIDTEDISCSILKFKNNALGELHLDFLQRPDFRSCKIIGSSGVIYWDSNSNNVKKFDIEKKRWITKFFHAHYKRNEMYEDELDYFLKCIKTRTKTMNDISNGIKTLETSLAILKSSKNNSRIKI